MLVTMFDTSPPEVMKVGSLYILFHMAGPASTASNNFECHQMNIRLKLLKAERNLSFINDQMKVKMIQGGPYKWVTGMKYLDVPGS